METLLFCLEIWSELIWVELLVSLLFFLFRNGQSLKETKTELGWERLFAYIREGSVKTWTQDQMGTEEVMINNYWLILHNCHFC